MREHDPHHRTDAVINACLKYPDGLGLNDLASETGISKETLYGVLDQKQIFETKTVKGRGGKKFKIRLKEMTERESQIFDMINQHFQAYLDEFPKLSKTSQIETIVHFLQTLSVMNMLVYLQYLNTSTSLEVSQQIIQHQLEKFKTTISRAFSKTDAKTTNRLSHFVNQQVSIAATFLAEKADGAMNNAVIRTKKRTIEDLLFDLDLTIPRGRFIDKLIAIGNIDVKSGQMSKKQFNSLPLKLKKTETKWFKEFTRLQTKLTEKELEMLDSFVEPAMQKHMPKISDEDFESRIQAHFERRPELTPEEKKAYKEWLLSYRKSVKP